jgi:hypothetical protein
MVECGLHNHRTMKPISLSLSLSFTNEPNNFRLSGFGYKSLSDYRFVNCMGGFKVLFFCGCSIEEAMVARFPYIIPEEFANKPLLKREGGGGNCRDESEGERVQGSGFNIQRALLQMVVDGYNAPLPV